MIIFGWRLNRIDVLDVDLPQLKDKCEKHNLPLQVIIGKLYYTLYFIPLNYFFAKERVFQICPKCSKDYGEVSNDKIEDLLLKYYHKEITINDLKNKINEILKGNKLSNL